MKNPPEQRNSNKQKKNEKKTFVKCVKPSFQPSLSHIHSLHFDFQSMLYVAVSIFDCGKSAYEYTGKNSFEMPCLFHNEGKA